MAEIVSFTEKGNKPVSVLYLKLVGDGVKSKREVGVSVNRRIMVKMPYIKEDVPIVFVFRALGFCEDKEILQMVGFCTFVALFFFIHFSFRFVAGLLQSSRSTDVGSHAGYNLARQ
jgi:hypothetical protein